VITAARALGASRPCGAVRRQPAAGPQLRRLLRQSLGAEAIAGLDPEATVVLIGTGLTMVDTVQSLLDAGHRGPFRAISRRGLLPRVHAPTQPLPLGVEELPHTTSVARLTRWLRHRLEQAEARDIDWRAVIDGLRPHVQDLWRRLPVRERARFLRHLRPYWDVHRHRTAPEIAQFIERAASGAS
jgi:uncharacterized NAD(P)/FAD-binding protein YdhS